MLMPSRFDRRTLLAGLGATATAAFAHPRRRAPLFSRNGKPLGVQLYALGDAPQTDMVGTLRRLRAIGYGDFELPGLYGRSARSLRADADTAGVRFSCIHLNMPQRVPPGSLSLTSSPQEIADALGILGICHAVLPLPLLDDFAIPPGGDIRSALASAVQAGGLDLWKRLAGLLNERAAALTPHGIALGYHNHNMEFRPQAGTTGWQVLMEELDPKLVFIELDLGWVAAAGLDPADLISQLRGRIRMVHLKDIKASTVTNYEIVQDPAEVGLGKLDWHKILPACVSAGVEHYYVEQEPPYTRDRFESMKISRDFLAKLAI